MGHPSGRTLAFETEDLNNVKKGNTSARRLVCKECKKMFKTMCELIACSQWQYVFHFDDASLAKKKKGNGKLICKGCIARGYSTKKGGDVSYTCCNCGMLGHERFNKDDLKNKGRRSGMVLRCIKCKQGWPNARTK